MCRVVSRVWPGSGECAVRSILSSKTPIRPFVRPLRLIRANVEQEKEARRADEKDRDIIE